MPVLVFGNYCWGEIYPVISRTKSIPVYLFQEPGHSLFIHCYTLFGKILVTNTLVFPRFDTQYQKIPLR